MAGHGVSPSRLRARLIRRLCPAHRRVPSIGVIFVQETFSFAKTFEISTVATPLAKLASNHRRLFWILQFGGWALLSPAALVVTYTLYPDWATALLGVTLRQSVGFVLTLGLWQIYRRWPARDFDLRDHALTIAAACVAATLIDLAAMDLLRRIFALSSLPDAIFHGLWVMRGALYLTWSALYFLIRHQLEVRDAERHYAQAEVARREAELLQLRAQMNPHFLFNALGTIIAQAADNPKGVADTTQAVADYLHYSLAHNSHHAPLGAEFDAIRKYLQVESTVQGPHRLEWRIDASVEARRAVTPTALIQPLVENAIKYGILTSPKPLHVRVSARVEGGAVFIVVENTGEWVAPESDGQRRGSTGIGLANLRRRLELLYGGDARMDVSTPTGLIRVEIRLPFQT